MRALQQQRRAAHRQGMEPRVVWWKPPRVTVLEPVAFGEASQEREFIGADVDVYEMRELGGEFKGDVVPLSGPPEWAKTLSNSVFSLDFQPVAAT